MRWLYLCSTVVFWLSVTAFWVVSLWPPSAEESTVAAAGRVISAAELAEHSRPGNCWMAIRGGVYDLSAYLPEHPSRPDLIQAWCGREATEAYNTKARGRQHSAYADEMLARYRIGKFVHARP